MNFIVANNYYFCTSGRVWQASYGQTVARNTYWRDAGVVDRGGLENRCAFGYPGFESLSLRQKIGMPTGRTEIKTTQISLEVVFYFQYVKATAVSSELCCEVLLLGENQPEEMSANAPSPPKATG